MRYYTYCEPTSAEDSTPIYVTLSEEEVLEQYWDYWYERMCSKFGKEHVDKNYTKIDCLDCWMAVNWAWESENGYK